MKYPKGSIPAQSPKEEILSNLHSSKLIGYSEQFREMRGNPNLIQIKHSTLKFVYLKTLKVKFQNQSLNKNIWTKPSGNQKQMQHSIYIAHQWWTHHVTTELAIY